MAETLQHAQKLEMSMHGLQDATDDSFSFFGPEDVGDVEKYQSRERHHMDFSEHWKSRGSQKILMISPILLSLDHAMYRKVSCRTSSSQLLLAVQFFITDAIKDYQILLL